MASKKNEQKDFLLKLFGEKTAPEEPIKIKVKRSKIKKGVEALHQENNPKRSQISNIRSAYHYNEYLPERKKLIDWLRSQGIIPPKRTKRQMNQKEE